jgi:hypothetical protein
LVSHCPLFSREAVEELIFSILVGIELEFIMNGGAILVPKQMSCVGI